MITHELVFPGSSMEFYRRIRRRAEAEVRNYFSSDKKIGNRGYIDSDGYEYAIRSIPIVHEHNGNIYRLEFKVEGNKAERGTPSKIELACLIVLVERIDGQTDIVAELHHPAFEPEFNSIFGLNEQDKPGANNSVESSYQQDNLTKREKEVAHLLANGKGDKEIAEELMIESSTAKDHCESISNKWGLGGTTAKRSLKPEAKKRGYGTQPRG